MNIRWDPIVPVDWDVLVREVGGTEADMLGKWVLGLQSKKPNLIEMSCILVSPSLLAFC